jgi:endonuclease/exonuclease/phosphatase family metal-dependent hydrolase
MAPTPFRRLTAATSLLALLALTPTLSGCDDEEPTGAEATVTVMTRNLYLGGDLFVLLDPNCGGAAPVPTPACVAPLYFGGVVPSDVPARMEAVAAEIEANDPDLVGLQEVSLYRTQFPGDFVKGTTTPNATTVSFDFLQLLLDALEARGLAYEVVATNTNADVELPATLDGVTFTDIRLTDRDVILARVGIDADSVRSGTFDVNATVEIGGVEVAFTRGYSEARVTKDGVAFAFANTHLEVAADSAVFAQLGQAVFLTSQAGFADTEPLILVGDFNADPASDPDLLVPDAYGALITAFEDAWADLRSGDDGFTCCFAANLDPDDDDALEERIDLVLYQGDVDPVEIGRVGADDNGDLTATGLWPSDHAGVVATLTVRE